MKWYLAPLILISGNIFYTGSFSLAKYFSQIVSVETIMLFWFLAGPVYLIPYFIALKKTVRIQSYRLFALRILFGISGMSCLFLSFKYGQIGKSMLIFECATIWTLLYGYFTYKNIPHHYSLMAIPFACLGIILVIQPDLTSGVHIGDFFALLGSILNAGVYITLKQLRNNHDTSTVVLITYICSASIMAIPTIIQPPSLTTEIIIGLCIMCSIGFIGQLCMTTGFKYATAGISSLIMLSIIPFTTLSGILIFGESYNLSVWIGIGFILTSLGVISRFQ